MEEILDVSHTMESVLADIEESLRYEQRTRRRRARQHELEANMAKVALQLWLTSEGDGADQQFVDTNARIKQIEKDIIQAMNESSRNAR